MYHLMKKLPNSYTQVSVAKSYQNIVAVKRYYLSCVTRALQDSFKSTTCEKSKHKFMEFSIGNVKHHFAPSSP